MRVTIQNLGIIQHAEFDLKPLTVLVDPNNTGKTWLASTLASILGIHISNKYSQAHARKRYF
jgi:predicted ATPase